MSFTVKKEPMEKNVDAAPQIWGERGHCIPISLPKKVDASLAALAQFQSRLEEQQTECNVAFDSLKRQVVEAVCAQQQELAAMEALGPSAPLKPRYYTAAAEVVTAANVLFRYFFEGLFAHQLDAYKDLAGGLERAAERHVARTARQGGGDVGGEELTTAIDELRRAIHLLQQAPALVLQAQRASLPEIPLFMGPSTTSQRSATPLTTKNQVALCEEGKMMHGTVPEPGIAVAKLTAPTPPNLTVKTATQSAARRLRRTFAISATYSPTEQCAIAALVRSSHMCNAFVLPPSHTGELEEVAARQRGCCCLVTETPAQRPVPRVSMAYLQSYAAARAKAVATPPRSAERRRRPEEDAEGKASPVRKATPHQPSEPPAVAAGLDDPFTNAAEELAPDGEVDEDWELMELLERLDRAANQDSFPYGLAGSASSPLLSQSQVQLRLTQPLLVPALIGSSTDGASPGGYPKDISLRVDPLSSLSGVGKRPRRPFIVEKASASFSQAARGEERVKPPRQPRRLEGHTPDGAGERLIGDTDLGESAEHDVIPSQLPVLSALESQTVQYDHGDSIAGRRWLGSVAATSDPNNALERALVANRPPPQRWLFQVSNSCKDKRGEILEAIRDLGSEVDTGSLYNPEATHLVVAEGITERTEKYLSTCAAGKFIVPPRYVLDSARRGHWLLGRMAEYNTNPLRRYFAAADSLPAHNALGTSLHSPPFAGWRVLLLVSHPSVANGIRTVLRAGGCSELQVLVFNGRPESLSGTRDGEKRQGQTDCVPPHIQLNASAPAGEGGAVEPTVDPVVVQRAASGYTDNLTSTVTVAQELLDSATHLLVECLTMSCQPDHLGRFELPPWVPPALKRREQYPRLFTLELLYYCLCKSEEKVFNAAGALIDENRLIPACRVEPTEEAIPAEPASGIRCGTVQ